MPSCPARTGCCRSKGFGSGSRAPAPEGADVAVLLETAIASERSAQRVYTELARAFSYLPGVAQFWREMAREEAGHAALIQGLRQKLSAAQLSRKVSAKEMRQAAALQSPAVVRAAARVRTLEEAYTLACRIESSETVSIFEMMLHEFVVFDAERSDAFAELSDHQTRLQEFGFWARSKGLLDARARPAAPALVTAGVSRSRSRRLPQ